MTPLRVLQDTRLNSDDSPFILNQPDIDVLPRDAGTATGTTPSQCAQNGEEIPHWQQHSTTPLSALLWSLAVPLRDSKHARYHVPTTRIDYV